MPLIFAVLIPLILIFTGIGLLWIVATLIALAALVSPLFAIVMFGSYMRRRVGPEDGSGTVGDGL